MLSIIDLKDYIDLDIETVQVVSSATRLPLKESVLLAQQCLGSDQGRALLHHMYLDQIAEATANFQQSLQSDLLRAYGHFSRKYPARV